MRHHRRGPYNIELPPNVVRTLRRIRGQLRRYERESPVDVTVSLRVLRGDGGWDPYSVRVLVTSQGLQNGEPGDVRNGMLVLRLNSHLEVRA